jgi:hypothetical protein
MPFSASADHYESTEYARVGRSGLNTQRASLRR